MSLAEVIDGLRSPAGGALFALHQLQELALRAQGGDAGLGAAVAPHLAALLEAGGGEPEGGAEARLGPSAAALLAKYGYSSVLGGGGLPAGGSAVPTVLGPASGAYPMVQGGDRG